MFDQLPRSKFSSLSLAWASFSFDKLKSLEEKKDGSGSLTPDVSRAVISSLICPQLHLGITEQGSYTGKAEPGGLPVQLVPGQAAWTC